MTNSPAPALTEATMDKLTVERLEELRAYFSTGSDLKFRDAVTLCDLARLALSPPQDVAGLIEDLRGAEWICDDERLPFSKEVCRKAADAILSLSARNRELEGENGKFTIALGDVALLDGADGHELTSGHASQAVEIAKKTLGKHPSQIFSERFSALHKDKSGGRHEQ